MRKQKSGRAKQVKRDHVDLNESSIYGNAQDDASGGDYATEAALERLESITGGADDPVIYEGELGERFEELDASTDEELDALQVNLLQEDDLSSARDGSGIVVDDIAEERIAKFTETGPYDGDQGVVSVSPGDDNTSSILRMHHLTSDGAHADAILEGNLDEPEDEVNSESWTDEDTGA
jgi:hypothetical protein